MAEHRFTGPERYPGYDVLTKRRSPSWNDKTREVIDARLRSPCDSSTTTKKRISSSWGPEPARVVQIPHASRLRRGLADRLARNVGLLPRGRGGAEDLGARQLSMGAEA